MNISPERKDFISSFAKKKYEELRKKYSLSYIADIVYNLQWRNRAFQIPGSEDFQYPINEKDSEFFKENELFRLGEIFSQLMYEEKRKLEIEEGKEVIL